MSDIVGALVRAGLRIASFEEYPYVAWPMFPWMEERADGAWQFPGGVGHIPLDVLRHGDEGRMTRIQNPLPQLIPQRVDQLKAQVDALLWERVAAVGRRSAGR